MTRSGKMPPIEMRPLRPVAGLEPRLRPADVPNKTAAPAEQAPRTASASDALDPGAPPVDAERVTQIRKAIESGNYPVLPARIADAVIAAGLLLRTGK
jgi:negative regulator of flagellin synthesis FlgM